MQKLVEELKIKIKNALTINEVEKIKAEFLGKDSFISKKMEELKSLSVEEKKIVGKQLNEIKNQISEIILSKRQEIEEIEIEKKLESERIDITIPGRKLSLGSIHPISQTIDEMLQIFSHFGFEVKDGPNIEDDLHNFTALNVPKHHPARLMQDTFYLNDKVNIELESQANAKLNNQVDVDSKAEANNNYKFNGEINTPEKLLRTHTSTIQIRAMNEMSREAKANPSFRFVSFGRVYRKDSDATHTPMFHQIEVVVIEENINFGHLKGFLHEFLELFFERRNVSCSTYNANLAETKIASSQGQGYSKPYFNESHVRFRPSFFPFTEPSAEVDISLDAGDNWLEVLGCGMIHPNVLKNVGIDPEKFQGFAFGLGIERFAMLKYGINDLRHLYSNDIRLNKKYNFSGFDLPSIMRGLKRCE
jgi:phenylalanyl-tRNA synthetase alpha chain